jgi:hypothetical protein
MSIGWKNQKPKPVERFHALILEEFQNYRKSMGSKTTVEIDGIALNLIIALAKTRLFEEYPEIQE